MNIDALTAVLRLEFEPLQYAAFFAALAVLGLLETRLALSAMPAGRRRRWPANTGLTVLNILVLGALPLSALAVADWAEAEGWGLLRQPLFLPPAAAIAAGFVLRSLVSYAVHVAMHKIPLLWRVHRVHHTDTEMDVSTTVRFHPLEFVISVPPVLAAVAALGIPPLAVILYELFDALMAVFTHANVRLPGGVERALRLVLVTPAMHRIHHSTLQPETDSNYGATFSWWDRLFGTYRTTTEGVLARMPVGLTDWRDRRTDSLGWLLVLPFFTPHRALAAPPTEWTPRPHAPKT